MPKLTHLISSKDPTGGGGGGEDPAPLKDPFPMDGDQVTPKNRRVNTKKKKSKTRPSKKSGQMKHSPSLTRKQRLYYTNIGVFDEKVKVIDLTPEKVRRHDQHASRSVCYR